MADENKTPFDPNDGTLDSMISPEAQLALLKKWFPWLGEDEDQSGADTVDTLVQWFESVGGISDEQIAAHEDLDEDDEDDDGPYYLDDTDEDDDDEDLGGC